MRKFLIKIVAFFALIVCIDIALGKLFDFFHTNAKGGMTYRDYYICNQLESDILLCGSSRCVRHYNPQIISDSLGVSCYNTGQNGNGIILLYGRLQMIKHRTNPQLIIYDVIPEFDLLKGEDNHKYLTWLKPYYDRKEIRDIFLSIDKTEQYKMLSKLYQYNSHFIEILTDYFHPIIKVDDNGFVPAHGDMDKSKIRHEENSIKEYQFDSLKIYYLNKYAETVHDNIVFCVSPLWYGMDERQLEPVKELCQRRGILFLNYANNPKYKHNDDFFKDGMHLNATGADEFTKDLIVDLSRNEVIQN